VLCGLHFSQTIFRPDFILYRDDLVFGYIACLMSPNRRVRRSPNFSVMSHAESHFLAATLHRDLDYRYSDFLPHLLLNRISSGSRPSLPQSTAMERITKVFFNPLATTKAQIRDTLEKLSVGSAHPFSPDKVLLYRTATGIEEIDISSYPEEYFFNAIDLSELGETLQRRMTGFQFHIGMPSVVLPI